MAIALNLKGKSDAFIRGYLERATRYDKCTPGKTVECGKVCRKPENCKQKPDAESPKGKKKEKKEPKVSSRLGKAMLENALEEEESRFGGATVEDDETPFGTRLGQVFRIPQKFMKTKKSGMSSEQIDAIASEMKRRGKNIMPVMVKQTGEDKYEVVGNSQIVEAARKAKLDFVWTVVVDNDMARQMDIEMGRI